MSILPWAVAVLLGVIETIRSFPAETPHASIPEREWEGLGIPANLLRLSIGLEDLIKDLE